MKKLGLATLLALNLPTIHAADTSEIEQLRAELLKTQDALQSRDQQVKRLQAELDSVSAESVEASGEMERSVAASGQNRNVLPLLENREPAKKTGTWRDDLTVAVGTKVWVSEWTTSFDNGGPGLVNNDIMSIKANDNQAQPIATATVKFKDFLLFGSYVADTDYDFATQNHTIHQTNGTLVDLRQSITGSRQEWDINLGYQVHKYLALTAGYKEIQQSLTSNYLSTVIDGETINGFSRGKATYAGPTLGGVFSVPLGKGLGAYGQFAYGWLNANTTFEPTNFEIDYVDYYIGELGLLYSHNMKNFPVSLPVTAATIFAGYRMQSYDSHIKNAANDSPNNDLVKGFVSGVNFAF